MTHTFQVGDRVIGDGRCMFAIANKKEPGTVVEVKDHGAEVRMDRSELNRGNAGMWFFGFNELTHDAHFRVGDWVRYEGANSFRVASKAGQVGQITSITQEWVRARGIHADQSPETQCISHKDNLVKIHPPQEKPMDAQEAPEPTDPIEVALIEKARALNIQAKLANACLAMYQDLQRALKEGCLL